MNAQSRRVGCRLASGALALGLIAGAPMFVAGAWAQQATIVDPNAPKEGQSAHDAALAAAARRDYVTALELSKKAAADGHPLESDQVEFISGKAAQQQAANADAAATKAKQEQAAAAAQQIETRQQKDYAKRSQQQQEATGCDKNPTSRGIGIYTSAAGAAGSTGASSGFGARITGADDPKCGG